MDILDKIANFTNPRKPGPVPDRPLIGDVDFEELKNQRLQIYDTITLDLATARTDSPLAFIGTYIYCLEATDSDTNIQVKFNENTRKSITLVKNRGLRIPFYRLFFTNAAQVGKEVTLVVGSESDRFEVFDGAQAETSPIPSGGFVFGDMWDSVFGTALTEYIWASQCYNFYTYTQTPSIGDYIIYKMWAEEGARVLHWLGWRGNTGGIAEVYLDNVLQGSVDFYRAATQANYRATVNMTALTTGEHTVKLLISGKNPASGDYFIAVTHLRIK